MGADDERSSEAARDHRVRDFLYHLVTYLFVVGLLVILDVRGGRGPDAVLGLDWAYWIALFWGFGLAAHAVHAFTGGDRTGAS